MWPETPTLPLTVLNQDRSLVQTTASERVRAGLGPRNPIGGLDMRRRSISSAILFRRLRHFPSDVDQLARAGWIGEWQRGLPIAEVRCHLESGRQRIVAPLDFARPVLVESQQVPAGVLHQLQRHVVDCLLVRW